MQKTRALLIITALCWFFSQGAHVSAQEDEDTDRDDGIFIESDWDVYIPDLYSMGDQMFIISLGTMFPAIFVNNGKKIDHNFTPPVGGVGSLSYNYFLGSRLFLGAEIGVKFNYTLAKNVIFIIPIGLRTGCQFVFRRFEFPLTMVFGFAPQRYLNNGYVGFFMKGGAGAYFRFNPDWSFGINGDWSWYVQRPKEDGKRVPDKNVDANIIGLTLSARYHF
jgi:hypothetical protein